MTVYTFKYGCPGHRSVLEDDKIKVSERYSP